MIDYLALFLGSKVKSLSNDDQRSSKEKLNHRTESNNNLNVDQLSISCSIKDGAKGNTREVLLLLLL